VLRPSPSPKSLLRVSLHGVSIRIRASELGRSIGLHRILLLGPVVAVFLCNCATLREIAALRQVDFALDRVGDVRLAGISIAGKTSYQDFSLTEAAQLASAVARRDVSLSFVAHVGAENPSTNAVTARLVAMLWTAYIEDRQTVSGGLDREYQLSPGQRVDLPLQVDLDLYDFYSGRAADLFQLARSVAGSGEPTTVSLRAKPTIQTAIGPIEYPGEITILRREVGRSAGTTGPR
jgi:hypothetical protein